MTTTEPIKGSPESSLNLDVDPTAFENTHVHQVYESIASHFSSTRYKPWPVVDRFLRCRKPGEVGLDVGCGNGKYLGVNPDVFVIGSDRSPSLIAIAAQLHHSHPPPHHDELRENQHVDEISTWSKQFGASTDIHQDAGRSKPMTSSASVSTLTTKTSNSTTSSTPILPAKTPAGTGTSTAAAAPPASVPSNPASKSTSTLLVADTLSLPHPAHSFDFAICIAVIHHLATRERRVNAISEILRVLKRADAGSGGSTSRSISRQDPSTTTSTSTSVEGGRGPGQALLFVWALEQKSSRRGWDTGMQKDRFVPWVLNDGHRKVNQNGNGIGTGTGNVNRNATVKPETDPESECEEQSQTANLQDKDKSKSGGGGRSSVEKPEPEPEPHPQPQIRTQTEKSQTTNPPPTASTAKTTFHRFYHLYSTHELDAEVADAGGRVVQRGYDRDNWWVVVEPVGLR